MQLQSPGYGVSHFDLGRLLPSHIGANGDWAFLVRGSWSAGLLECSALSLVSGVKLCHWREMGASRGAIRGIVTRLR